MPLYPSGLAQLNQALLQRVEKAARAAAEKLVELSSQEGSGVLYPGLPRRSSAPGEFPALQAGHFVASLGAEQIGPLAYAVGSFSDQDGQGYREAVALESKPPDKGGRFPVTMAFNSDEVRAAALNAAKEG